MPMRNPNLAFWLLFGVTIAVYLIMIVWTLPAISAQAQGLPAFDLRPGGYTPDEAREFVSALTPEGAAIYLGYQHWLDFFYPALLGATLFLAILALVPQSWGLFRWALAALAIPGAVFDYLENGSVAAMLRAGAEGITDAMAETASFYTVWKSGFSAVAMTLVLILLIGWMWRRWRAGKAT